MIRIAHRGASGVEPENTLAAFQKAVELGIDGIELDVHLSADGEVIVIHDETLDRTTNGSGHVAGLHYFEIQKFRTSKNQQVPKLSEVLDLVGQKCMVNIELKGANTAEPVARMIEHYISKHDWHRDLFLISSFDWTALQNVRSMNPKIPIGVLTATDIELAVGFAEFIKAETIHPYYHLLSLENVAEMNEKGFDIFTWTVNEPSDIELVKSLGVSGIITDFPDRL